MKEGQGDRRGILTEIQQVLAVTRVPVCYLSLGITCALCDCPAVPLSPVTRARSRHPHDVNLVTGASRFLSIPWEIRHTILELLFQTVRCYVQPIYSRCHRRRTRGRGSSRKRIAVDALRRYYIWAEGHCSIVFLCRQCYTEALPIALASMTYDITRGIGCTRQSDILLSVSTFSRGLARYIYGLDVSSTIPQPRELRFPRDTFTTLRLITFSVASLRLTCVHGRTEELYRQLSQSLSPTISPMIRIATAVGLDISLIRFTGYAILPASDCTGCDMYRVRVNTIVNTTILIYGLGVRREPSPIYCRLGAGGLAPRD
jgi:hypothetical protein